MLFPALAKAGASERVASVPALLGEHEQGRALIKAMEEASSPVLQPEQFSAAAKAYSGHLREHIEKENKILFPEVEDVRVWSASALKCRRSLSGRNVEV